jgi:enediyne biosynthesis protein E4
VLSQSSYYSHDDVRLHFGLGDRNGADRIEIHWPAGGTDTLVDVAGRRLVVIKEGTAR